MFQLNYDKVNNIVTALTDGAYDTAIAKEQMHEVISVPALPEKIRVLRVFKNVTFSMNPDEVREHFAYVQQQLNKTHIKQCYLAIVTDAPLNTALGFLYQSNKTTGSCYYSVMMFSTEEAATQWLMHN